MEIRSITISYTKHKGKQCRNRVTDLQNRLAALEIMINNSNNEEQLSAEIIEYDNLRQNFNVYMKPKGKAQFFAPKSVGLSKVKNLLSISLI